MKRKTFSGSRLSQALCLLVLGLGVAGVQAAEIRGYIIKTNGQRVPETGAGAIRYLPAQKKYLINVGPVALQIPVNQRRQVVVAKPPQMDAAINAVRGGAYSSAIPVLEQIMRDYRMLQWDIPAAENLTLAYLKMGQPAKAVEMAETAIKASPQDAYSGGLARLYWDALVQSKQSGKLRRILLEAVERGSRDVAATAQVMRGNIDFERGNYRDALVDGYLRTIVLFQDVKNVQPEALFKAIKSHEKLGEHSHAEKWRKKLLSEFPESTYSRDLRSGS